MKTLYLLRHAKAEPGTQTLPDEQRKLAARGREACQLIGNYMRHRGYVPGAALVSPAARTRETFDLVIQAAGFNVPLMLEKRLYMASLEDIVGCVQGVDDAAASMLLVGHNPGMHHAAVTLAEPDGSPLYDIVLLKYPTGTLTVLQFEVKHWANIQPETGLLSDLMTPKELETLP